MKLRAFVDGIEEGAARLVVGSETLRWPARLLPAGAVEGTWVEIDLVRAGGPPDDSEERRARLKGSDDGGDIGL